MRVFDLFQHGKSVMLNRARNDVEGFYYFRWMVVHLSMAVNILLYSHVPKKVLQRNLWRNQGHDVLAIDESKYQLGFVKHGPYEAIVTDPG